MNDLDDLNKISEIDPAGMLKAEEQFYGQLTGSKDIIEKTDLINLSGKQFKGLAILGMGGSGFSGDIIKALVADEIEIPVEVVKGYNLPAFVGEGWLVMAVSYSGNTEETISALNQGIERDCNIIIECSGGKLEKLSSSSGYTMIKIPSGLQPRGAIGYLFYPAYLVLDKLGLIDIDKDYEEEALELIKEKSAIYNRNTPITKNPAKKLAVEIGDRLPIVYGTEGISSALSYRLKCEINENGKTPCWWHNFAELNHNETVGWERLSGITKDFTVITFRDPDETPKIRARIDVTLDQLANNVGSIIQIPVEGRSKLAKALSTLYLGDIASVYHGILTGVDPTPVVKIESLKKELAKLD
jgi:glucose/mannose-6-phosphate isomerase